MIYQKNLDPKLSLDLFKDPTSEYRAAPFWAWNCKLNKDTLLKQIDYFKEMGMGGFHIHCRTGLATEYLGDEFMELVSMCNEKAKEKSMLCWLYDEDRYSSGFGGGLVTKDLRYRARAMVFSPRKLIGKYLNSKEDFDKAIDNGEKPRGYFIAKYEVILKDGYLNKYKRINEQDENLNDANIWWSYMELAEENSWCNYQTYVNTLDSKSISKFVEVTHERYFSKVGKDFGKSIPAIFTDEPKFSIKEMLRFAEDETQISIPYTDDFNDTFIKNYDKDFLDFLPEIFWELPDGKTSVTRYQYHDHISERFSAAFADTIGKWCEVHGLMLTGHMMGEETLQSQTAALGEVMRSFRSFQLPGIDILCDNREYSTAKQAQSATHQYGRVGVISELYGVTNWDFDFKKHKMAGDWQAALGVTVRVPHLAWVSMEGEGKRDYPASIGYQSPWFKEYPLIENHFARVNTALTRGEPVVRIGIIHPVESCWIYWGPLEQTFMLREELENNFKNIVEWSLFNYLDFDFIAESLLPELCPSVDSKQLKVGKMNYDVIVVPGCITLRSTTVDRLEAFTSRGGSVIFAGDIAKLVDAVESDRVEKLAKDCKTIKFSKNSIVNSLEEYREIDIRLDDGTRPDNLIYQMRKDGEGRWLFIGHAFEKMRQTFWEGVVSTELPYTEKIVIKIKNKWKPTIYNTMNGEVYACESIIHGDDTWIFQDLCIHDSLLLFLEPGVPNSNNKVKEQSLNDKRVFEIEDPVSISLSEPNVYLMDLAEYSFDSGEWHEIQEILRIDNALRTKLGYPLKEEAGAQPWVNKDPDVRNHDLSLKFVINSEIEIKQVHLALENAEMNKIFVNGTYVPSIVDGWYVDESIKTVKLTNLNRGKNEIIVVIPYGLKANVEYCYLLGNFGVRVDGKYKKIIEPVNKLVFGDWVSQGLPFYAGNVTYHCNFFSQGEYVTLVVPKFNNPVLSVSCDGKDIGKIALAPYKLDLGFVEKGGHSLDITAFGNRINAFGQVHNCDDNYTWFGSPAWRTGGDRWSYQYRLKPMGILVSPKVTYNDF